MNIDLLMFHKQSFGLFGRHPQGLAILGCAVALVCGMGCSDHQESLTIQRWGEGTGPVVIQSSGKSDLKGFAQLWEGQRLENQWQRAVDRETVTMISPLLPFDQAEEIGHIEVEAEVLGHLGGLEIMWGASREPSDQELLTARRYFPISGVSPRLVFDLSGSQISEVLFAEEERPVRYLFLRFPVASLAVERVRILPRSLTSFDFEPIAVAGQIREALVLMPPASLEVSADLALGSRLQFALASHRSVSGEVVVTLTNSSKPDVSAVRVARTLDLDRKWIQLEVPLGEVEGESVLRIEVESPSQEAVFCSRPLVVVPGRNRPPNVVLYVVDALRASSLGCYGAKQEASAFIDELASRGVLFERCLANCSWTKPSVTSLLTSLSPQIHGLGSRSHGDALPPTVATLQSVLRQSGYLTASFSANPLATNLSNLHYGFDVAWTPNAFVRREATGKVGSEELSRAAIEWIGEHSENPFFVYMHSMDPHTPLTEWEEPAFIGNTGSLRRDLYAREIFHNDREIEKIYRWLESRGLDGQTLFIVTADHGEAFDEHGTSGHGTSTYQEEVHVPLVMVHPGLLSPGSISGRVQLVDLMPTILNYCGVDASLEGSNGVDILDLTRNLADREVFSTRFAYPLDESLWIEEYVESYAIVQEQWKLVVQGEPPNDILEIELFNLDSDPLERKNISAEKPDRVNRLLAELVRHLEGEGRARESYATRHNDGFFNASVALSTEEQLELQALGYIVSGD